MTLRQALGVLEREGLIEARRGRGTFVSLGSAPPREHPGGVAAEEPADGAGGFTRLLSFRVGKPTASAREFFGVSGAERVYQVRRLRLRHGAPVAVEFVQVPQALCPTLSQLDLVHESFYRILEERYGLRLAECLEEITATRATRTQMRLLEAPPSAAVLMMRRRTRTSGGVPALFEVRIYRGDRYTAVRSVHAPSPDTAVPSGPADPTEGNTETLPAARNEAPGTNASRT
jgi:GntR family transcriptional regulator